MQAELRLLLTYSRRGWVSYTVDFSEGRGDRGLEGTTDSTKTEAEDNTVDFHIYPTVIDTVTDTIVDIGMPLTTHGAGKVAFNVQVYVYMFSSSGCIYLHIVVRRKEGR